MTPFSSLHNWPVLLVVLWSLVVVGCEVSDSTPAEITVRYTIDSDAEIPTQHPLRYEVIWMGNGVYEVTDRGQINNSQIPFAVRLKLPSANVLQNVLPVDTLSYNFHYLPEPSMRRPRIVVYEDRDGNAEFNINHDRIVALDGVGYDRYGAVAAMVDVDGFLSQLSPEEHYIYYGWTEDEYTAFIFVAASLHWNSHVYPVYENAYTDDVAASEVKPILNLQAQQEMQMKTDLACFRQTTQTSTEIPFERWVDASLDVDTICLNSEISCTAFDSAQGPDLNMLEAHSDVIDVSCNRADDDTVVVEIAQGYITCENCSCEVEYFVTYFTYHPNNIPFEFNCIEEPQTLSE